MDAGDGALDRLNLTGVLNGLLSLRGARAMKAGRIGFGMDLNTGNERSASDGGVQGILGGVSGSAAEGLHVVLLDREIDISVGGGELGLGLA